MDTYFIVVLFSHFCAVYASGNLKTVEICQKDVSKKIECPENSAILIRSAKYGRYNGSKCYTKAGVQCTFNATSILEIICSGRDTCDILVSNKDLMDQLKCKDMDQSFALSVTYTCQMYHRSEEACSNQPLLIHNLSGYLFSSYTLRSNKGSTKCPWKFELGPSQTLKLSIFNFNPPPGVTNEQICTKLVTIEGSNYNNVVCTNDVQSNHIKNDEVIKVVMLASNFSRFALQYEVLSCPIFNKPEYVKELESNSSEYRLQCIENPQIFLQVKCFQGSWTHLSKRNCTLDKTQAISSSVQNSNLKTSQAVLILLVIMIALVISIVIIVVGCYCLRTHTFRNEMETSRMDMASLHHMTKYSSENILDFPPQYNSSVYSMSVNDPYYLAKRDYATTLQMRQLAGQYPDSSHCCPAHGPYAGLMNTIDRQYKTLHMPHNHVHPAIPSHHHSIERALDVTPITPPADRLYHELDHFSMLPSLPLTSPPLQPTISISNQDLLIQPSNST